VGGARWPRARTARPPRSATHTSAPGDGEGCLVERMPGRRRSRVRRTDSELGQRISTLESRRRLTAAWSQWATGVGDLAAARSPRRHREGRLPWAHTRSTPARRQPRARADVGSARRRPRPPGGPRTRGAGLATHAGAANRRRAQRSRRPSPTGRSGRVPCPPAAADSWHHATAASPSLGRHGEPPTEMCREGRTTRPNLDAHDEWSFTAETSVSGPGKTRHAPRPSKRTRNGPSSPRTSTIVPTRSA
jgi:hypothetical protein